MCRIKWMFITSLMIAMLLTSLNGSNSAPVGAMDLSNSKVLSIVADGVGKPHFEVKAFLEQWDCEVSTVGLSSQITPCPHSGYSQFSPDFLISEVEITEFDCIFIASGYMLPGLGFNSEVINLVISAYQAGLIIAAVCWGPQVLARAGIINGTQVTGSTEIKNDLVEAGGIYNYDKLVIDGQIVTAGRQDSYPMAYGIAIALGSSYVVNTKINPTTVEVGTSFNVSVETTNHSYAEFGISGVNISVFRVYSPLVDRVFIQEIQLGDSDKDGIFTGALTLSEYGDYAVDVEVTDLAENIEEAQYAFNFTVGGTNSSNTSSESTNTSELSSINTEHGTETPGWTFGIFSLGLLVLVLFRRSKQKPV